MHRFIQEDPLNINSNQRNR